MTMSMMSDMMSDSSDDVSVAYLWGSDRHHQWDRQIHDDVWRHPRPTLRPEGRARGRSPLAARPRGTGRYDRIAPPTLAFRWWVTPKVGPTPLQCREIERVRYPLGAQ